MRSPIPSLILKVATESETKYQARLHGTAFIRETVRSATWESTQGYIKEAYYINNRITEISVGICVCTFVTNESTSTTGQRSPLKHRLVNIVRNWLLGKKQTRILRSFVQCWSTTSKSSTCRLISFGSWHQQFCNDRQSWIVVKTKRKEKKKRKITSER